MNLFRKKFVNNKKFRGGIKAVLCLLIVAGFFRSFFINGIDDYISYKDYFFQNEFEDFVSGAGSESIEQKFIASGNILSNLSLYLGEVADTEITIEITDCNGQTITQKIVNLKDYVRAA